MLFYDVTGGRIESSGTISDFVQRECSFMHSCLFTALVALLSLSSITMSGPRYAKPG